MVEVVNGSQLGLVNSSVSLLGARGGVGSSRLGQNGDQVFVNAATGNLIIQGTDELLDAYGSDLSLIRTYNSQGLMNDANGDNWRLSVDRRVYGLTGTANTAGSTVTKMFGDGTEVVYTYNTTLGRYTAKDGSNANDTLSWNATNSQWTWTNGASQAAEVYNSTGQMISSSDLNGNSTTYTYTGSYLTSIADASGQTTYLDYTGNNLTDVRVVSNGVTQTRTTYSYDASNRLKTVTVALTPGNVYTTTYTYDGTSTRVASITQSDGTTVSFTYTNVNGAYRVATFTDGDGNVTNLSYVTAHTASVRTPIDLLARASAITLGSPPYYTVAAGDTWASIVSKVYGSSDSAAAAALQTVMGSPALTAGTHINVPMMFTYTPAASNTTFYQQTTITAPLGQVTTINADSQGRLLSTLSPTVGSGSLETDFTYDAGGNVATIINDPSGRHLVTTLQYDSNGNLLQRQDAAGNTITSTYDSGNRLITQTTYTVPTPGAAPSSSAGPQTTRYAYDQQGNLRFVITPQGRVTEYRYDAHGSRITQIVYSSSTYNVSGLASYTTALTEMNLIQWVAAQGQAQVPVELTSYTYDFRGNLTTSTTYTTAVAAGSTGQNLTGTDIGSPSPAGSSTYSNGVFTIKAGGGTFTGTSDPFQFDSQAFNGDGSIIARVASQTTPNTWVSGVMIRDSLDPAAMNIFMSLMPGTGAVISARASTGGGTAEFIGPSTATAPYWVKLTRVGNLFAGYCSADGLTWTLVNQATLPIGTAAYAGLAVMSTQSGTLATATFDNVSIVGGSSAAPSGASVTQYTYDQRGLLLQKTDPRGYNNAGQYVTNYTYDGLGRPLTTVRWTSTGNVTTSTEVYTGPTKTATVTLANGTVSTSTYDAAGHLLSVAVANGATALGTTAYVYDANGQLRRTIDPDSNHTDYIYDAAGRKEFTVTGAGDLTEYVYDQSNNVVETIHYASPANLALLSSSNGNPLPSGSINIASLRSSAEGNSAADIVTRAIYDSANRLVYSIDGAGNVAAYSYDGASQIVSIRQYGIAVSIPRTVGVIAYTPGAINGTNLTADPSDRLTRNFYDADGNLLGVLDAAGYLTINSYDAAGNSIRKTVYATQTNSSYWAAGTLAQLTPASDAVNDRVTYYFYDGQNHQVGVIDPLKFLTVTSYDLAGNVSQVVRYPNSVSWTGTPTLAAVQPATLAGARITTYTYDELNRVLSQVADTQGLNIQTTYAYDSVGNLITMVEGAGSANPRNTTYTYDGLGRKITETVTLGSNQGTNEGNAGTANNYDAAGNLTQRIDANGKSTWFVYDADNRVVYTIDALGDVTQNTYDDSGNITAVRHFAKIVSTSGFGSVVTLSSFTAPATDPTDRFEQTIYDGAGRALYQINAAGAVTQYFYDAMGEVVQTTAFANAIPAATYATAAAVTAVLVANPSQDRTLRMAYDARGRVRFTIDGLGDVTETRYDALGNIKLTTVYATVCASTGIQSLSAMTSWVSSNAAPATDRTTQYWYDAQGREILKVDALGYVTQLNYNDTALTKDTIRYATAVTVAVGSTFAQAQAAIVTSTDDQHTLLQLDTLGRVLSQTDASTQMSTTGAASRTQSWLYDAVGNKTQYTDQHGTVTLYTYDANHRLTTETLDPTSVNPSGLNIETTYTYDALGNILTRTEGYGSANPRTTTYGYDNLGRISSQSVALGLGQGSAVTAFKYDAKGNLTHRVDADGNSTWYVYDAENRLIDTVDALGGVTRRSYDAYGETLNSTRFATAVSTSGFVDVVTPAQLGTVPTSSTDRTTQDVYDNNGNVVYSIDAAGYVTQNVFDAEGNLTQVTSFATAVSAGTYTSISAVNSGLTRNATLDHTLRNVYDADGELRFTLDSYGDVTQKLYNAEGNLTQATAYYTADAASGAQSLATMKTWASSNASASDRTTRYWYDGANRQVLQLDAAGYATQTNYNDSMLTRETLRYSQPTTIPANSTTAAALGSVNAVPANDQYTLITFDRAGRTAAEVDGYQSSHATTQSWLYDAVGNKTQYTNQNGAVWTYVYDANHRLIDEQAKGIASAGIAVTTTAASGTGTSVALTPTTTTVPYLDTHMIYDALGNVRSRTEGYGLSGATGQPRTTSYGYDALGRQTSITYPSPSVYNGPADSPSNSGISVVRTETSVPSIATTTYNTLGDAVVGGDVNGNYSHKVYDKLGHVLYEIDALNAVTWHTYDAWGNETSVTRYANPLSTGVSGFPAANVEWTAANLALPGALTVNPSADRTITKTYDLLGRAIQITQPQVFSYLPGVGASAGGTSVIGSPSTLYDYDAFGDVTRTRQLVDPTQNVYATAWHYYDGRGLETTTVTQQDYEPAQTYYLTSKQYDSRGNLTQKLDYATPLSGAPTFPSATPPASPASSPSDRQVIYTYDALNRIQTKVIAGLSVSTISGAGTSSASAGTATASQTTSYQYDGVGNQVAVTDTNGNSIYTYYDALGRIVATAQPSEDSGSGTLIPLTVMGRDAFGDLTSSTQYAGGAASASATSYSVAASPVSTSRVTFSWTSSGSFPEFGYRVHGAASWLYVTPVQNGSTFTVTIPTVTAGAYDFTFATSTIMPKSGAHIQMAAENGQFTVSGGTASITSQTVTLGSPSGVAVSALANSGQDRTTLACFDANGHALYTQDPNGNIRQASYDRNGNLAKQWQLVTDPNTGVVSALVTINKYDALNHLVESITPQRQDSITQIAVSDTVYDTFGEVTQKGTYAYQGTAVLPELDEYDQAGRLWRKTVTDGTHRTCTVYLYDLQGNQTAVITSQTTDLSTVATPSAALAAANTMRQETRYDLKGHAVEQRSASFTAAVTPEQLNASVGFNNSMTVPVPPNAIYQAQTIYYGKGGSVTEYVVNPTAWSNGGGYYQVSPPSSTNTYGTYAQVPQPEYQLVQRPVVYWNLPSGPGVAVTFQAVDSSSNVHTLTVNQVSATQQGVDVSTLANGTYTYTITYTRPADVAAGNSTPYAVTKGSFTVNNSTVTTLVSGTGATSSATVTLSWTSAGSSPDFTYWPTGSAPTQVAVAQRGTNFSGTIANLAAGTYNYQFDTYSPGGQMGLTPVTTVTGTFTVANGVATLNTATIVTGSPSSIAIGAPPPVATPSPTFSTTGAGIQINWPATNTSSTAYMDLQAQGSQSWTRYTPTLQGSTWVGYGAVPPGTYTYRLSETVNGEYVSLGTGSVTLTPVTTTLSAFSNSTSNQQMGPISGSASSAYAAPTNITFQWNGQGPYGGLTYRVTGSGTIYSGATTTQGPAGHWTATWSTLSNGTYDYSFVSYTQGGKGASHVYVQATGTFTVANGTVSITTGPIYTTGSNAGAAMSCTQGAPTTTATIQWVAPPAGQYPVLPDFGYRVHGSTGAYTYVTVSGTTTCVATIAGIPAGTYDYIADNVEHLAKGGVHVVDSSTGTFVVTASSLTVQTQVHATPAPIPVSYSGASLTWNQAANSGDTVSVSLYNVSTQTSQGITPSGSGSSWSANLTGVASGYYTYTVYYTNSSGQQYLKGWGDVTITTTPVTVSGSAATGVSGVTSLTQDPGTSTLRWTPPANGSDTAQFAYQQLGGSGWTLLPISNSGSSCSVNLSGLTGTILYEITYIANGTSTPYLVSNGSTTLAQSIQGGGSETYVPTVGATVTPRVQQTYDRWGDVTSTTDASGDLTSYAYNVLGEVTKATLPTTAVLNTNGNLAATNSNQFTISGPANVAATEQNYYDNMGRLIGTQDADGNISASSYNADGLKLTETDADGGNKQYVYDVFGDNIQVTQAQTATTSFRTRMAYDNDGQVVAIAREITAGSGQGFMTSTPTDFTASNSSSVVETDYVYDAGGRRVSQTNGQMGTKGVLGKTQYVYDLQGHIESTSTPRGYTETYQYDLNGNKTKDVNANGDFGSWTYDYMGNLLTHTDMGGTVYSITYQSLTSGSSGFVNDAFKVGQTSTIGGVNAQNVAYAYDAAGHLISITDTGAAAGGLAAVNRVTTYAYDSAGRQSQESVSDDGLVQQNTLTTYDSQNRISRLSDLRYNTAYTYDAAGNRTEIASYYVDHAGNVGTSTLYYAYDQMNRVFISQGSNVGGKVAITSAQGIQLTYDLKGERTSATQYSTQVQTRNLDTSTEIESIDFTTGNNTESYTYDGLGDLLTTSDTQLRYTNGVYKGTGSYLADQKQYDKAQRVVSETSSTYQSGDSSGFPSTTRVTTDTYDGDGRLATTTTALNGNAESYITYGDATQTSPTSITVTNPFNGAQTTVSWSSAWGPGYDAAGVLHGYVEQVFDSSGNTGYTSSDAVTYRKGETYQQTGESINTTNGTVTGPYSGSTSYSYNVDNQLVSFVDSRNLANNRYFADDANSHAITVVQGQFDGTLHHLTANQAFARAVNNSAGVNVTQSQHYFYALGQQVGTLGQLQNSNGAFVANFDVNYTPVSSSYPASTPSQVIAQQGDTLSLIAARLYGDPNLWYVIAQANGLTSATATIPAGTVLQIPNSVVSLSNTGNVFKPYNASAVLGNTTPTQPLPPPPSSGGGGGCGVLGQILIIVVAVIVTIYTAGATAELDGAITGADNAFSAGLNLMSGGLVGSGTVSGSLLSAAAAGAIGGAAGSIASQGVAIATGMQSGFDWNQVAVGAIGGAVTAGGMYGGDAGAFGQISGAVGGAAGTSYAGYAAVAATDAALTQGIAVATGVQKSFNWSAVAGAAVAAPLAAAIGENVPGIGGRLLSGLASAFVRQAIDGKIQPVAVAADAFGGVLGNSLVDTESAGGLANFDQTQVALDATTRVTLEQNAAYIALDADTAVAANSVANQVAADNQGYFAQRLNEVDSNQQLRILALEGQTDIQAELNSSLARTAGNLVAGDAGLDDPGTQGQLAAVGASNPWGIDLTEGWESTTRTEMPQIVVTGQRPGFWSALGGDLLHGDFGAAGGLIGSEVKAGAQYVASEFSDPAGAAAFYVAGPVPSARYHLGVATVPVDSVINLVNSVGNIVLDSVGTLTEPIDKYQGEITTLDTALGPAAPEAIAATAGLGGLSRLIRSEAALNETAEGATVATSTAVHSGEGAYGELVGTLDEGFQAHHLNQNAAFSAVIPKNDGFAIGIQGNAFTDIGTPHYDFHSSLETFWDQYRDGGELFGEVPTGAEYGKAVTNALEDAGFSPAEAQRLSDLAAQNRAAHGLLPNDPTPRIPGKIYQSGGN